MKLSDQEFAKMQEFVQLAFDFARQNDAASLKIMLDHGLNPNLANHKGDTLLMLASYYNSADCVRLLLDFKAEVDKPNDRGHTPLAGVAFKGYANIAQILLEAGANPNGAGTLNPINTAMLFGRKVILELLLRYHRQSLPWWKRLYARILGVRSKT